MYIWNNMVSKSKYEREDWSMMINELFYHFTVYVHVSQANVEQEMNEIKKILDYKCFAFIFWNGLIKKWMITIWIRFSNTIQWLMRSVSLISISTCSC